MKRVDVRRARRALHRRAVGAGAAVGDVVFDGVVEEHRVLRDDADRLAQALLGDAADVLAVDRDAPGVDVVEAKEQARQRALARARRPDHGDRLAGRDLEAHAVQDLAVAVVAEADIVEANRAAGRPARRRDDERRRVRRVGDLAVLAEQREHLLQVDQRLLDLAVDHAEEVERDVELDHQRVDQHEVAERHRAGDDADGRPPDQQRDRGGDDQALAEIEQRQRRLRLDRYLLEPLQVLVVAGLLEGLVREVLDRLVVEQRVEGLRVGLRVLLVHRPAEGGAPFGHGHREADVDEQRAEGDRREPAVELGRQQDDHHRDLDQRRQDVVDRVVEQRLDRARAALDVARDAAGLALEVEAQAELQQVLEGLERDAPRDPRRDRIEEELAQLGEQRDRDAQRAVGDAGWPPARRARRADRPA